MRDSTATVMNNRKRIIEWLHGNARSAADEAYIGEIAHEIFGDGTVQKFRSSVSSAIGDYRRDHPGEVMFGSRRGWFWFNAKPGWKYPDPKPRSTARGSRVISQLEESLAKRSMRR